MLLGHRLKWNASNMILIYVLVDVWFEHYFKQLFARSITQGGFALFSNACSSGHFSEHAVLVVVFPSRGMDPNLEKPSPVSKSFATLVILSPQDLGFFRIPNGLKGLKNEECDPNDLRIFGAMAVQELPQSSNPKSWKKHTHTHTSPPQTARRSATSDPKSQPADAEERQLTLGAPWGFWKLGSWAVLAVSTAKYIYIYR